MNNRSCRAWTTSDGFEWRMHRDPEEAERDRVRAIAHSLRTLVNGDGVALGMTTDLVKHLLADGLNVGDHELHKMLMEWGFEQAMARLEQGPRRAWSLPDAKLAEIEQEAGAHYPPPRK
jgi:hypothetical protein